MAELSDLSTAAASNTARFPENMQFRQVNNSARELEAMIARTYKDNNGSVTAGGSSNAYTMTPNQTIAAYADGQRFCFEANHTNTAAATLNVSGLGAKTIKRADGTTDVSAGDLVSGCKYDVLYNSDVGIFQLMSNPATTPTSSAGKHTIWMPAAAMTPRITNGAAVSTVELATNDVMLTVLDFDTITEEGAGFWIALPKSWNEGTVTFKPYWTAASGSGGAGVVWSLAGYGFSDDDAMDTAVGTAQTSTDAYIVANDCHVGPESSAITIGGTPAAEDACYFELKRVVGNASDTLAADARLIGIKLYITTDAATDL